MSESLVPRDGEVTTTDPHHAEAKEILAEARRIFAEGDFESVVALQLNLAIANRRVAELDAARLASRSSGDGERLTRLMALLYEGEATCAALRNMDAVQLVELLDRMTAISRGEHPKRDRTCTKCGAALREQTSGAYRGLLYCEDFCDQFGPRSVAARAAEGSEP